MDFLDDEEDVLLQYVTNYHFVDENEKPVSFSTMPICFDDANVSETPKGQVFLHGHADNGLQKVFKQILAWKIMFLEDYPEISVLSKDKKWIKLVKARKIYEESIRTTVLAIHLLHYLKNNPNASEKNLWDHLRKVFSTFEAMPSEADLGDHLWLLSFFAEHDEALGKSELLQNFIANGPLKRVVSSKVVTKDMVPKPFIVEEDEEMNIDGEEDSDEESDLFDSVCAICDNGGEILCCEGKCMRSFHGSKSSVDDDESNCETLGFTQAELKAIQNFLCKNCEYKQHQCFACGKLGSSDKTNRAEVYKCVSATCGHFYHPRCTATLLFPESEADALDLQKKIENGESFTCPVHKCTVCKQGENKNVEELHFAMCRRCPISYHRKCLPREISFDVDDGDGDEDTKTRAWDGLLQNHRILIYCLKHEIDEDLGTPMRNHIIFPGIHARKADFSGRVSKAKELITAKKAFFAASQAPTLSAKSAERLSRPSGSLPSRKSDKMITNQASTLRNKTVSSTASTEVKPHRNSMHAITNDKRIAIPKEKKLAIVKAKTSIPSASLPSYGHSSTNSFVIIDAEKEKRVLALLEKIKSSVTHDVVSSKQSIPSLYSHSPKLDKNITHGKIEGSIEAIRAALQKIENGGTVEDAKAVCEPAILKQLNKWSNKLRVYLSPFIHGPRYSSYGRHFTKTEKLNEIVERIHWYVQNGDTVVDFCCGKNDFSYLMKQKLDATGKVCSFKNYDIHQAKIDFCFEIKDWMTVERKDLPTGSQLVMGLNPPFGVKAALANKFIDKALTFKPKLLVLIVPKETERLDKKSSPYDLIWEDDRELSGKSFYLPGSVDTEDKQIEQWNNRPPVLYLWSRPDWTAKHRAIAAKHGHDYGMVEESLHGETVENAVESGVRTEQTSEYILGTSNFEGGILENRSDKLPEKSKSVVEGDDKTTQSKRNSQEIGNEMVNKRTKAHGDGKSDIENGISVPKDGKIRVEVDTKISRKKRNLQKNESEIVNKRMKARVEGKSDIDNRISQLQEKAMIKVHDKSMWTKRSSGENVMNEAVVMAKMDDLRDMSISPTHSSEASFNDTAGNNAENIQSLLAPTSVMAEVVRNVNTFVDDVDEIAKKYTNNGGFTSSDIAVGGLLEAKTLGGIGEISNDFYGRNSYNFNGSHRGSEANINDSRIYNLQSRSMYSIGRIENPYSSLSTKACPSLVIGQSTMPMYPPHLQETKYSRPGPPGPSLPVPGQIFDLPGTRRDSPSNSMGYVHGAHQPYSKSSGSSGWIDD